MKFVRCLVFMLTAAVVVVPIYAADVEVKKPITATGELSVLSTNGNSKTTTTGAKLDVIRTWELGALDLIGGGLGSSNKDTVTAEEYFASEKASYNLSERSYLQEKYGWNKNRFAGIRSRHEVTAGLGHKLLLGPVHQLVAELGAGHIWEDRTDEAANNFASGRAYSKYTWVMSPTANFTQDAEYLHDFENSKDYRLNTETALTASLTSHLALKTSFKWRRVGVPPAGFIRDDTTTSVALVVNY